LLIRVDSWDYEVIREPSIVSVGVPTYIYYIYIKTSCLLRDFKRKHNQTVFLFKALRKQTPLSISPISLRHLCFPSIWLPHFTVIYCCCVPRRAHRTEKHFYDCIQTLYLNNVSSSSTSLSSLTLYLPWLACQKF